MGSYSFWTLCNKEDGEVQVSSVPVSGIPFVKYGYVDAVACNDKGEGYLYFRQQEYGEAERTQIMQEAAAWEIRIEETEGYDMGYGTSGEDTSYSCREVYESEILVAAGHFIGVIGRNTWGDRANPTKFGAKDRIALIDHWNGEPMLFESSSSSFSSDDHESWSYTGYYLRKK